jgi:environmental stress-induced protein Ves
MQKISKMNYAALLSSFREMAWKNGGGTTREIAIHPQGSELEKHDFLWRLSSAQVSKPGPFSIFPDCRRLLTVIDGGELVLRSANEMVALKAKEVFSFSGSERFSCELPRGPVTDLSMVFREKVKAEMNVLAFSGKTRSFQLAAESNFFFVISGTFAASTFPGEILFELKPGMALRVEAFPSHRETIVLLEPQGKEGAIATIEIDSSHYANQ